MLFDGTIVGLPRSRTYWFSKLLTHDRVYCYHDYFAYHSAQPPVRPHPRLNASACPWLPTTRGRTVIIERDRVEAEASYRKFVLNSPLYSETIKAVFDLGEESLSQLDGLRVQYEDIDDRLAEIITHLGLRSYITDERLENFKRLNLQSPDNDPSIY